MSSGLKALAAIVFLFGLLTLNAPGLNGDEALYLLVMDEIHRIASGHWPSLNPIVHYAGPLDFWFLGSVYALMSPLSGIEAAPWMVRLPPFLLFWFGTWTLYREVDRRDRRLAPWVLFLLALAPMTAVYSRVAWPHAVLLGIFLLLFAESLRVARTGEVRWLRIAILSGIAAEAHSTVFIGVPAVFFPVFPTMFRDLRRRPWVVALAAGVFLVLAYPVLRNFPPPVSAGGEGSPSIVFELRNFLNTITGQQPLQMWLHGDLAPAVLQVLFLVVLLSLFFFQLRSRFRSGSDWDQWILRCWGGHAVASLALFVMCYRGRSLTMIGHERYFLALVPGWTFLWADAFSQLASRSERWQRAEAWVAGVAFLFLFARSAVPIIQHGTETDPNRLVAQWLRKECPHERCLVYAENFWNYWPIRYYTRDSIDVNFFDYNWKAVSTHPRAGRELAGCWLYESEQDLEKLRAIGKGAASQIVFDPQALQKGQICFKGIELPTVR